MRKIRSEAAEARHDRFAGFGMKPHFARQRQKLQRLFQIHRLGREALGNAGALRLLAIAQLHIGTEAPRFQRDFLAALGIDAERARLRAAILLAPPQLARVAAFGIIRTADEGAKFSELEIEPAIAAS